EVALNPTDPVAGGRRDLVAVAGGARDRAAGAAARPVADPGALARWAGTYERLHHRVVVRPTDRGLDLATEPSGVLTALGVRDAVLSMRPVESFDDGRLVVAGRDPATGLREVAVLVPGDGGRGPGLYLAGRLHRRRGCAGPRAPGGRPGRGQLRVRMARPSSMLSAVTSTRTSSPTCSEVSPRGTTTRSPRSTATTVESRGKSSSTISWPAAGLSGARVTSMSVARPPSNDSRRTSVPTLTASSTSAVSRWGVDTATSTPQLSSNSHWFFGLFTRATTRGTANSCLASRLMTRLSSSSPVTAATT